MQIAADRSFCSEDARPYHRFIRFIFTDKGVRKKGEGSSSSEHMAEADGRNTIALLSGQNGER